MLSDQNTVILPTVSRAFLEDWLQLVRQQCPAQQLSGFLDQIGLVEAAQPGGRVTHDQIVRFYQLIAAETGDEMMGLWSRPIRSGTLKHLCASMRGASSLSAALYRFTSFWNLLLDDYELLLEAEAGQMCILLEPRGTDQPQRFGHMLMLKLAHGVASWLTGRELPLAEVGFAFERPVFSQDYPVLFPAPILFGETRSRIVFRKDLGDLAVSRSELDMQEFLLRAPRDWIFTSFREHALSLHLREMLLQADRLDYHLRDAARELNLTPRTLIRRLDSEGTSFQSIKDGLRRDIAIRDLSRGLKSIEEISQDLGFASAANFHRAFRRWTDATPGSYRGRISNSK
ncbi:AraC family transcriptional regulator [Phaeobacter sp. 11ANDIMAR09]|uniref:AraC family transcriptional regulator n=1 Tax=Phaeobacter sp. 11ANDIMAR09 TaxID=1225647 RepID=UPI0006C831BB|nr:AraC family transcriptional regulator [Phaeobacter sp. 11ANDIMAR09]KPD10433.1 AraC family transcriptional regulator [Phaeobacter sp. 11ANDIMAR09]